MNLFGLPTLIMSLLAAATSADLTVSTAGVCTLTGTYKAATDISACSTLTISGLTVPAGVTLDLSKPKTGAKITFSGTTTFGTKQWEGPLVLLSGSGLTVSGTGTLDGQGAWYWPSGQSITRPLFFRLNRVSNSNLSSFKIKNSPSRTFSILGSTSVTVSGLTLDSTAGKGVAKNTDGFDLGRNDHVTIKGCTVINQDDCLAMQSSTNTIFEDNSCTGGHGISIGSIGGPTLDRTNTVSGLIVRNNKIIDNKHGLRIKTIENMQGSVFNVTYTGNVLTNVKNAIALHSDYSKEKGGYTTNPSSLVTIKDITIDGLSGTATKKWDVLVNPAVVGNWKVSGITLKTTEKGTCKGQPSGFTCN